MTVLPVSERRACLVLGQIRSTQRYIEKPNPERDEIRERVIELAGECGRYGYRQITNLLNMEGFDVGKDHVYSIWRLEGLRVPQKQPKRARLWLANGSCIRLRPEYPNHVWSYDFVADRTHDGRLFKILNIIDEYTRECICSYVARRIRSQDVILILADLFLQRGIPRSDNGSEFVAKKLIKWMGQLNVSPLHIQPGSPWENGYCESFNGKMRYELLDGELFYTLLEAKVIIEKWRKHYNEVSPHSSLGGIPPAPVAKLDFSGLQNALISMIEGSGSNVDSETKACVEAYRNGWKLGGAEYQAFPTDFTNFHHGLCYRLFNISESAGKLGMKNSVMTPAPSKDFSSVKNAYRKMLAGSK